MAPEVIPQQLCVGQANRCREKCLHEESKAGADSPIPFLLPLTLNNLFIQSQVENVMSDGCGRGKQKRQHHEKRG